VTVHFPVEALRVLVDPTSDAQLAAMEGTPAAAS
jgi:hypothetical protein